MEWYQLISLYCIPGILVCIWDVLRQDYMLSVMKAEFLHRAAKRGIETSPVETAHIVNMMWVFGYFYCIALGPYLLTHRIYKFIRNRFYYKWKPLPRVDRIEVKRCCLNKDCAETDDVYIMEHEDGEVHEAGKPPFDVSASPGWGVYFRVDVEAGEPFTVVDYGVACPKHQREINRDVRIAMKEFDARQKAENREISSE